jgi:hypothetical protein
MNKPERMTTLAIELLAIAALLVALAVWFHWLFALPRAQALAKAPAWSSAPCDAMSVIPFRNSARYARCAPFGTVASNPLGFLAWSAGVLVLIGGCVVAGRRRRAAWDPVATPGEASNKF